MSTALNAHGSGRYDFESETFIAFNNRQDPITSDKALPLGAKDNGNGILSGIGVRRLTPVECERLQGFPDGWTGGQADTQRYKQLGNAVAVPVAQWIGQRIVQHG